MSGLSLGALPHFWYQPIWVAGIFISMLLWRGMAIYRDWPLPSQHFSRYKALHISIAISAFFLLFISYGNLIGRDAGVGLLTVMLGLKIVEIRNHRDFYISSFLGYFLVVTNFFYSQSIPTALLMCLVVLIMTVSLISLNTSDKTLSSKAMLKLSSKMLLQAVPLMLLLFVLFPRISGPLWGLPQDAHSSVTGISDSMSFGNISQLTQSNAIAFRVTFDGDIPSQSQRYWRGPVLWHSDGKTWTELKQTKQSTLKPDITTFGDAVNYTSTIEPHNKQWLFALDLPDSQSTVSSQLRYDGQLLSQKFINQRENIQLSSYTNYQFNPQQDTFLDAALQLPNNQHPRAIALAKSWQQNNATPEQIINKALDHFKQNAFYYTLRPPPLSGDVIDQFLFETRQGFCEHYAASMTILMRAAGIPARVVTGYLGGEVNPVDNVLIVRQRDAHAWVEVWLQDKGWIRIDPTASVSQDRIEQGFNSIAPAGLISPLFIANSQRFSDIWQNIRNNWDALDNAWNQWVLAYGPELQKDVLRSLGMTNPNWQNMALWLAYGFVLLSLLFSAYLLYQRPRQTPVARLYQQFCLKAERAGIRREVHQGPLAFGKELKRVYPDLSASIDNIIQRYIDLQYGHQQGSINELKQAIKDIKFSQPKSIA